MGVAVYLSGKRDGDTGVIHLPLTSHSLIFLLKYCHLTSVDVIISDIETDNQAPFPLSKCAQKNMNIQFVESASLPDLVQNVQLPVVIDSRCGYIRSGLCCSARKLVAVAHELEPEEDFADLLGFRGGSCKACSETSGWTKLCEVELPHDTTVLIKSFNELSQLRKHTVTKEPVHLPVNLLKLEHHFKKDPLIHNRNLLSDQLVAVIKQDKEKFIDSINSSTEINASGVLEFTRETIGKHWKMQYCVHKPLSKSEHLCDLLKNLSLRNQSVIDEGKLGDVLSATVTDLVGEDIHFIHRYTEGITLTIADVLLFPYFFHLKKCLQTTSCMLESFLPLTSAWYNHMLTLNHVKSAANQCGYHLTTQDEKSPRKDKVNLRIPQVDASSFDDEMELSRSRKSKFKALKPETKEILTRVEDVGISPSTGNHPAGDDVPLTWNAFPTAVHPGDGGLPEKRKHRKCEQLENLVSAVTTIAKDGDVIVDFCSGGGHLGIAIAYLLPNCKVYLVENKEQSLSGAKERIGKLGLTNVVFYQCNMNYFHGKFDIGVCLHACGVATDMVQKQCVDRKASFVICPCCYGRIQSTEVITYPRSQMFSLKGISDKDMLTIGHVADQTEVNIKLEKQGKHCMNLVDTDRAELARENGYDVVLCSLKPLSCTTKNNLIIGTRSR